METDAQRMALLEKDPEEGMAAIMEQYGGLVWAVAARRLSNEEDVRECVNETFAQFYFEQSRYQPEKGSLGGWLARIAQRRAVDKWRAGRRFEGEELPENLAAPAGLGAEDRLDLEEALARLSPQDAEILRMKYFAGMTAKEIAAALDLPYETVKKRQQRGLERLRRMLIVGLVLALLALLAACGYALLRYFGVLPGYGVNTDPESSFAILARDVYQENDLGSVELSDGVWDGDRLSLTIQLSRGPGTEATMPMVVGDSTYPVSWDLYLLQDASLSLGGESYRPTMTVMDASRSTADSLAMELVFEGLPRPKGQAAVASLEFSWLSLPFVLDTAPGDFPGGICLWPGRTGRCAGHPHPVTNGRCRGAVPPGRGEFCGGPGHHIRPV